MASATPFYIGSDEEIPADMHSMEDHSIPTPKPVIDIAPANIAIDAVADAPAGHTSG